MSESELLVDWRALNEEQTHGMPDPILDEDGAELFSRSCRRCRGSGVDPSRAQRHTGRHRYTAGGNDEEAPCSLCNGTGTTG